MFSSRTIRLALRARHRLLLLIFLGLFSVPSTARSQVLSPSLPYDLRQTDRDVAPLLVLMSSTAPIPPQQWRRTLERLPPSIGNIFSLPPSCHQATDALGAVFPELPSFLINQKISLCRGLEQARSQINGHILKGFYALPEILHAMESLQLALRREYDAVLRHHATREVPLSTAALERILQNILNSPELLSLQPPSGGLPNAVWRSRLQVYPNYQDRRSEIRTLCAVTKDLLSSGPEVFPLCFRFHLRTGDLASPMDRIWPGIPPFLFWDLARFSRDLYLTTSNSITPPPVALENPLDYQWPTGTSARTPEGRLALNRYYLADTEDTGPFCAVIDRISTSPNTDALASQLLISSLSASQRMEREHEQRQMLRQIQEEFLEMAACYAREVLEFSRSQPFARSLEQLPAVLRRRSASRQTSPNGYCPARMEFERQRLELGMQSSIAQMAEREHDTCFPLWRQWAGKVIHWTLPMRSCLHDSFDGTQMGLSPDTTSVLISTGIWGNGTSSHRNSEGLSILRHEGTPSSESENSFLMESNSSQIVVEQRMGSSVITATLSLPYIESPDPHFNNSYSPMQISKEDEHVLVTSLDILPGRMAASLSTFSQPLLYNLCEETVDTYDATMDLLRTITRRIHIRSTISRPSN